MKSMTGFSFQESSAQESRETGFSFRVDAKSYNNRYLDVALNMSSLFNPLEPEIRTLCGEYLRRGRLELYIRSRREDSSSEIQVNQALARDYSEALHQLKDDLGLADEVTLSHILGMEGVLSAETKVDLDRVRGELLPLIEKALTALDESRRREGENTRAHILQELALIEAQLVLFRKYAPRAEEQIKTSLRERFQEVLGDQIDQSRVLAETAVLLVRYSINEELARLQSHLGSFRELADSEGPVGKKLDFLCQEIGREINTIGSKTQMVEVQQGVVQAKDALENIREQLRNIE